MLPSPPPALVTEWTSDFVWALTRAGVGAERVVRELDDFRRGEIGVACAADDGWSIATNVIRIGVALRGQFHRSAVGGWNGLGGDRAGRTTSAANARAQNGVCDGIDAVERLTRGGIEQFGRSVHERVGLSKFFLHCRNKLRRLADSREDFEPTTDGRRKRCGRGFLVFRYVGRESV